MGKVAFSSDRGGDYRALFAMEADGSHPVDLTGNPADDEYPYPNP